VVLLADDLIEEDRLMHALNIGARGYLGHDEIQLQLARAVRGVDRGEAWVPRKMLGKMVENALR
jgi:DNA-binding NarL/FixJ family response regulator